MNRDRTNELSAGVVYRRIPNRRTHFDEDAGRPERGAFEPRPSDNNGLSVDVDRSAAESKLQQYPGFGLCALDIAEIKRVTGGSAWVAKPLSGSHTRIENCDREEVQLALANIATVVIPPTFQRRRWTGNR